MNENDNLDWYMVNRHILVTLCPNQYLIIKDRAVLETFDTHEDAVKAARLLKLDPAEYCIEHCREEDSPFLTDLKLGKS